MSLKTRFVSNAKWAWSEGGPGMRGALLDRQPLDYPRARRSGSAGFQGIANCDAAHLVYLGTRQNLVQAVNDNLPVEPELARSLERKPMQSQRIAPRKGRTGNQARD